MNEDPSVSEDAVNGEHAETIQFRLSTIFVLTTIATVLAAYLTPHGNDLLLAGITTAIVCAAAAFVVGSVRAPLVDRIFWALVITAMMQAVCADIDQLDRLEIYAWPITAGLAAVFAASAGNLFLRMLLSAAAAAATFAAFATQIDAPLIDLSLNVFCAAIGGALLAVLIAVIHWAEQRHNLPQPAIGLVMVISAIGFSSMAPRVIPGW